MNFLLQGNDIESRKRTVLLLERLCNLYIKIGIIKYQSLIFLILTILINLKGQASNRDSLLLLLEIDTINRARIYNELASIYISDSMDIAFHYANKALSISLKKKDNIETGNAYSLIGDYYHLKDCFAKSQGFYKKALNAYKHVRFAEGIAQEYYNLGAIANDQKNYSVATEYIMKSIKVAKQTGQNKVVMMNYVLLAKSSYELGNRKNALANYKKHRILKDSISAENTKVYISEFHTKYETERKDKEMVILEKEGLLLEAELQRKKEYIKRRNIVIIMIFASLFVVIIFSVILYRFFRDRKHSNSKLKDQNVRILSQNRELENQRDKIVCQKNELFHEMEITNKQRDLIDAQRREILEGIDSAKIIKNAIFSPSRKLEKHFKNYYLIHRTKHQVQHDFFWLAEHNEKLYIAVSESLNNGVPGALMCVHGITLLSNLVYQDRIRSPYEILNQMRKNLVKSLHLNQSIKADIRDGLNIALCVFDKKNQILEYAGANLPVILLDNKGVSLLEADEMPIGLSSRMAREFRNQVVELRGDTTILMHSHGLRKIFSHDQLITICDNIYSLPFEEQKKIIIEKMDEKISTGINWKDVLMLGFRIN